jgi:hypothetical protein
LIAFDQSNINRSFYSSAHHAYQSSTVKTTLLASWGKPSYFV